MTEKLTQNPLKIANLSSHLSEPIEQTLNCLNICDLPVKTFYS